MNANLAPRAFRKLVFSVVLAAGTLSAATAMAQTATDSAVIFVYQKFGDTLYPANNTPVELLEAQIAELGSGAYDVRPVPEIVAGLFEGRSLGDRTIGITVDDAFLSFYEVAWPRLRKARLPVTLFVSTDAVDQGLRDYMSWDQIRELRVTGVTIGAHTASHLRMPLASADEIRQEMEKSLARFEAELGERPTLFSYPYGEISAAARQVVSEYGFKAAFGHQSGAMHASSDRYLLPRFPLNERYGEAGEFKLRANTLPLPVQNLDPADPFLRGTRSPVVSFTVDPAVGPIDSISCYQSLDETGEPRTVEPRATGERRYEVHLDKPMKPGAWRLNCTIPVDGDRWRWLGMQFYTAAQ
jgi:peptidoglycan/xylan/chitin deacetylase (PgdA/CDA1 family)